MLYSESLEKVQKELRIRNFSPRTIKSYNYHLHRFLTYVNKPLKTITKDDIKNYLDFMLKKQEGRSVSVSLSAIKFFFLNVLRKKIYGIPYPKRKESLPIILSKREVKKLINSIENPKHKLLVSFLYACGLRVSEAVKLRVSDIDFDEGLIYVRKGKGGKDRCVPLPKSLIKSMENLKVQINNFKYLFQTKKGHLSIKSAQLIVEKAAKKAGINKRVSPHTLRHSFATHLLESGVSIRIIQKLLGHKRIAATQIYTQISNQTIKNVKSPLDDL
ncbi:integrase [Candidatus Pacearchaeota archaeon ex4484_26]|nr:MAG: integrase [Candidatus Pacearchaeota archaeon ex4484_26]